MDSEVSSRAESDAERQRLRSVPLTRSGRRLSFERRLRVWLYLMGLPALLLCWVLLWQHAATISVQVVSLIAFACGWAFAVSLLTEQIVRPLQTLANVVASLREDDYSFRARGARRNDAVGDLALEVNALASLLQGQRASALEAMALVERVMSSMPSPVLAFDPEGRLKLLNAAGERAFGLRSQTAVGLAASELRLESLLETRDDELVSMEQEQESARWMVKRTSFRLRGVPHTLLVLSNVSAALREEERLAWERLIRVLGHEINNSLTPIKSIAGSLRGMLGSLNINAAGEDFELGLEVIESRAESLNRFLQAYRQLMGLPAPKLAAVSIATLVEQVARLETRLPVLVTHTPDVVLQIDADQIQQALINLVRNAAEAALGPDRLGVDAPGVQIGWESGADELIITVIDNGPGLTNKGNLFVPFYTTKPTGTGIGLVLAQQIAQAHRGSVQLTNRTDGTCGCRAELRLPLGEEPPIDLAKSQ